MMLDSAVTWGDSCAGKYTLSIAQSRQEFHDVSTYVDEFIYGFRGLAGVAEPSHLFSS